MKNLATYFNRKCRALFLCSLTLILLLPSLARADEDVMTHEELMRRVNAQLAARSATNHPAPAIVRAPPVAAPPVAAPVIVKPVPVQTAPARFEPPIVIAPTQPVAAVPAPAPKSRPAKSKDSVFSPVPPDFYESVPAPAPANPSAKISATPPPNAMALLDDKYRLAIGDRLSFRIVEDEDDPRPLVVMDSGELEVPYLGRFTAVGRSCKELAGALKAELEKEYYFKATVILAVDLMTRSRGKIYIVGPVRAPGPQEIPSDEVLTLSKAILRAGGFTDFADKKSVKVTRKNSTGDGGEDQTFTVNVAEILERGRTDADLPLLPGDLIYIQERMIRF